VPEVQVEPDSARRIALLWSPTFDPTKTAIVEQPVLAVGQAGGTGTAVIDGNGDDTLAIRARSTGPALLTISRTYHPSWQAEIDGVPVQVLRANHALMAVPLNRGGEHRVLLRYRPRIVSLAATVTAATVALVLLASAVAAVLHYRRQRG
jgi:Bacterial membrane protein YfhO